MDRATTLPHNRKRRRRRVDRQSVSARIHLDERLKGEVGVLSRDLFGDLFSGSPEGDAPRYVAIAPWMPIELSTPSTVPWTIVAVKQAPESNDGDSVPHSSLRLSPSALALSPFFQSLKALAPSKIPQRADTPIEIRILDVVPIALETVYITIDGEALHALDEVHTKFGGGFGNSKTNGTVRGARKGYNEVVKAGSTAGAGKLTAGAHDRYKEAVRKALATSGVVHSGDALPLPLPAHPITHVPPPPAKVTACEPVSQGLLVPTTRIVIIASGKPPKPATVSRPIRKPSFVGRDDEADDTSNESFYSAAEDRSTSIGASPPSEGEESTVDALDTELSGTEASDLSGDDEEIISLSAPMLPSQSSGILSSYTAATPRPGMRQMNGIATPGSVFSAFTATTVRGGPSVKSKVFKAHGLLEPLPDELIIPKPGAEDDEEARVYIDTTALVRIGCFSGDWVKVEVAANPLQSGLAALSFGTSGLRDQHENEWRPVKVYGLPECLASRPARYPVGKPSERRYSISEMSVMGQNLGASAAYLSPLLLANLGHPEHLRLSPLAPPAASSVPRAIAASKSKISGVSLPPHAKQVTLSMIATLVSTDRQLQPVIMTSLKEHFEDKTRVVKVGDLIAVPVDERLGKAIYEGNQSDGMLSNHELLISRNRSNVSSATASSPPRASSAAWFRVESFVKAQGDEKQDEEADVWGGAVSIDSSKASASQSGIERSRIPSTTNSSWEYYLRIRSAPPGQSSLGPRSRYLAEMPKPQVTSLRRRLRELISAATSPRAIHLGLPPLAILLTSTQRQIGKAMLSTRACADLGIHTFSIDAYDILSEGASGGADVKTEALLRTRADRAISCGPENTVLLLRHIEALTGDRMNTALKEILGDLRVLIATTTDVEQIPDTIRSLFTHELDMSAPDEAEREGILADIVSSAGVRLAPNVTLGSVAVKTAALVAGDLVDVVDRAVLAQRLRLESLAAASSSSQDHVVTLRDLQLSGGSSLALTVSDLNTAVDAARKNFSDSIGAPKIPNVTWDDVGGLSHVKDAVMETIQLPLSRPELFAKGMKKRSGILFYGPPGTGKTLLAKAIATEFSLNFFSVKGPELLNMYIGESEANVRRVFQRARDARPCVVFFDELDSVAPKRGNQGDSGGVMDRIVSQLLAELDGMSDGDGSGAGGGGVFVIGATNRPDLLDQALLRPGRFDKMLYLGISDTHEGQMKILEALTRKFTLDPDLSLRRVADTLPFTYTGADLYALCSDAMLKAITRSAAKVDEKIKAINSGQLALSDVLAQRKETVDGKSKRLEPPNGIVTTAWFFDHLAADEDIEVVVTEEDFLAAKSELVPSVSVAELEHYEKVRRTFEGSKKGPLGGDITSEQEIRGQTNGHAMNKLDPKGKGQATTTGKGKEPMLPQQYSASAGFDDDEYGTAASQIEDNEDDGYRPSVDKGKGKGKAAYQGSYAEVARFGPDADGDEEMYE